MGCFCEGGWYCRVTIRNLSCVNLQEKCQQVRKISKSQNKTSFTQEEKKEEARAQAPLWKKQKWSVWVNTGQLRSELPVRSVNFRILCVSKLVAPNSHSAFWLGGGCLVSVKVSFGSVKALVPLSPASICPVSFHCSQNIMRFGVLLWSVFPPLWINLNLIVFCNLIYYQGLSDLHLGSIGSCDLLPGF